MGIFTSEVILGLFFGLVVRVKPRLVTGIKKGLARGEIYFYQHYEATFLA